MVKKRYGRILYDEDSGDIKEDIIEQKAYPELFHKINIFQTWSELEDAQLLMMNTFRQSNRYNRLDVNRFENLLVKMFNFVREMIQVKLDELPKIVTRDFSDTYKYHLELFEKLEALETGKKFNAKTLIELKRFLLHYLHQCNLSNLLRKQDSDLDAFEKEYQ